MSGAARATRCKIVLTGTVRVGAVKPMGWEGIASYHTGEPLEEVVRALDISLGTMRTQLIAEIQDSLGRQER